MLSLALRTARTRAAITARTVTTVRLPDVSIDPHAVEPEAKVPFVYDFWDSKEKRAEDAAKAAAASDLPKTDLPKVIAVAEGTQQLTSNVFDPSVLSTPSAPSERIALPNVSGLWGGIAREIGVPTSEELRASLAKATENATPETTGRRNLSDDERSGAWMLAGILATGWLAGAILAPNSKRKEKKQEHH